MADMTADQLLADAKAKYHLLVTGQAARVVVDGNNGDRIEYQGASAPLLLAYIQSLDPSFLMTPTAARVMRPIGFMF